MTTDNEPPSAPEERYENRLVTLDDFGGVNFMEPVQGIDRVACFALEQAYINAAETARREENEPAYQVYRLLAALSSFHFRPNDRAEAFGPQMEGPRGRTAIPDDFRGEQSRILFEMLPQFTHPALRAQIADTIWTNDRKNPEAARAAIDSYRDCADGLLTGAYRGQFEDGELHRAMEQVDLLQRGFQIANKLHKRGHLPDSILQLLLRAIDQARRLLLPVPYAELVELARYHGVVPAADLAIEAEQIANTLQAQPGIYHMAVKKVWEFAAAAYRDAGDNDAYTRCRIEGVEASLAMQGESNSPMVKISWLRSAIAELRHITGTRDRQAELTREMRALQDRVGEDMGVVSTPIDLEKPYKHAQALGERMSPAEALYQLVFPTVPRSMADLRQEALDIAKVSPLTAMMPRVYFDDEGKVTSEAPGASLDGEPDPAWFHREITEHKRLRRQVVVQGTIEPFRESINANFTFSERHFQPIVENSAFVPIAHRPIFALGFARLIQGDFMSATHLLIPQVENSVRHVLTLAGHDPSKVKQDMRQEDRTLSAIVESMRPEMVAIFEPNNVDEIERLFVWRPGPAFRHEIAHGKIAASDCYHPDTIYACWYIYHLCCAPLLGHWDKIGPAIEANFTG
jgi:hypothetical protein